MRIPLVASFVFLVYCLVSLMSNIAGSAVSNPLDPTDATVAFAGGRLRLASGSLLEYAQFNGPLIEVNGVQVFLSAPLECDIADTTIDSTGADTGFGPAPTTLYYAYVNTLGVLRLSETAPQVSKNQRSLYLDDSGSGANWRFVGWVYVEGAAFQDSESARYVVNAYNKRPARLFVCPSYSDNNAQTTYGVTLATWDELGSVGFIANGEDAIALQLTVNASAIGAAGAQVGIGESSASSPSSAAVLPASGANESASCSLVSLFATPGAAQVSSAKFLAVSSAASTFIADFARNGATFDPPATRLEGWIQQ